MGRPLYTGAVIVRRAYALMVAVAVTMGVLAVICSQALDYPLRDPDSSFIGPSWVKIPLLLVGAFLADLVPRTLFRARLNPQRFKDEGRRLIREHWTRERITLVVLGLISFYITYVSYRNLKGMLVFFRMGSEGRPTKYDYALHDFDHWLMFGHDPATLLHNVLGTGLSAHLLSAVYLFFLPMVPIVVVAWAVWSRNISFGYWFITANCLAWALGTASYYLIPTMGPNFFFPWLYTELPHTGVAALQDALWHGRGVVRFDPLTDSVQSVAGFASLHVGITVTVALVAQYTWRTRWLKIAMWVYIGLTAISTTYFGWHYIADDIGGLAIALISVYLGAVATGQKFSDRGRHSHPTTSTKDVPVELERDRSTASSSR